MAVQIETMAHQRVRAAADFSPALALRIDLEARFALSSSGQRTHSGFQHPIAGWMEAVDRPAASRHAAHPVGSVHRLVKPATDLAQKEWRLPSAFPERVFGVSVY